MSDNEDEDFFADTQPTQPTEPTLDDDNKNNTNNNADEDDFVGDSEESDNESSNKRPFQQASDDEDDDDDDSRTSNNRNNNNGSSSSSSKKSKNTSSSSSSSSSSASQQATGVHPQTSPYPYAPPPSSLTGLLACKRCGLLQTFDQFYNEGCVNCPFLQMKDNSTRAQSCTTSFYGGTCALIEPGASWMGKWLRLNGGRGGVYAISVKGEFDEEVREILEGRNLRWRCKP